MLANMKGPFLNKIIGKQKQPADMYDLINLLVSKMEENQNSEIVSIFIILCTSKNN